MGKKDSSRGLAMHSLIPRTRLATDPGRTTWSYRAEEESDQEQLAGISRHLWDSSQGQKKALITPASIDSMARVALNNLESTSLSHSVRVHLIPGGEVRCYRVQCGLPGDCNPETENQTGRQKKQ